jgi:pentatricopeptide repeat protein
MAAAAVMTNLLALIVFFIPALVEARVSDAVINACASYPGALDVFKGVRTQGDLPDVITYNALIGVCARGKEPLRALVVFEAMVKQGVVPNLATYSALVGACAKGNQPERAIEIFEAMRERGVAPDLPTYRILLSLCRTSGRAEQAIVLLQALQQQGLEPDAAIYDAVISACASSNYAEQAQEVLQTMCQQGLVPSLNTFNHVIAACAKANQLDRALQVFHLMRHQGVVPDVITYNAVISASPSPQRALAIMREMRQDDSYDALGSAKGERVTQRIPAVAAGFQRAAQRGVAFSAHPQEASIPAAALIGFLVALAGSGVVLRLRRGVFQHRSGGAASDKGIAPLLAP